MDHIVYSNGKEAWEGRPTGSEILCSVGYRPVYYEYGNRPTRVNPQSNLQGVEFEFLKFVNGFYCFYDDKLSVIECYF